MDFEKFGNTIRSEMGTRTQKEFAEAIGVARETLSRWLNNKVASVPEKTTLRRMAKQMPRIDYYELLEMCGYDVPDIHERIMFMENNLINGIEELSHGVYKSISDFADAVELIYLDEGDIIAKEIEKDANDAPFFGAEKVAALSVYWGDKYHTCATTAEIYYAETKSGNIIVLGTTEQMSNPWDNKVHNLVEGDDEKSWEEGFTKVHYSTPDASEKGRKLLDAIFGRNTRNINAVFTGFGFYYNDTPAGFLQFLANHASAFCRSKQEKELFQRAVKKKENIETVFKEYELKDSCDAYGTGAVIATIMQRETNKNFVYYVNAEDHSSDCIMVSDETPWDVSVDRETEALIYLYAKELQIEEYGVCAYYMTIQLPEMHVTDHTYLR